MLDCELIVLIGRIRRAMPRNADVMVLCDDLSGGWLRRWLRRWLRWAPWLRVTNRNEIERRTCAAIGFAQGGRAMTQLGLFPPSRNRRVPELTVAMRLALAAIELCGGGPLSERRFNHPGGGPPYEVSARVLRRLIREGLIEVMGASPAVYRVTYLGRMAR